VIRERVDRERLTRAHTSTVAIVGAFLRGPLALSPRPFTGRQPLQDDLGMGVGLGSPAKRGEPR